MTVSSPYGEPVVGGRVTFTAPASPSSATFPGASTTAAIGASGLAAVRATANGTVGSYSVTASTKGAPAPVAFALANHDVPTITWASPASITHGMALGAAQLDAKASVPGSFTYSPAAGTVLHAGNNQTLSLTFTPTDSTDYAVVTATATIDVSCGTHDASRASAIEKRTTGRRRRK